MIIRRCTAWPGQVALLAVRRRLLATHAPAQPRLSSPQTFIEKVVQKYAVDVPAGKAIRAGDYVMLRPEHVMTHDNTAPVISKFRSIGASKLANPRQAVFTVDHDVQNKTPANLRKYANIEKFAHEMGVDFYPPGRGIGHQIMIEEGYAFPGGLMVASDSHSNMYGGVGCVGTPVVRTDAASIWATERTWWQVPPIVRVELKGRLSPGVTGKDIIVALCGSFNQDEVLNCAIEFVGEGVSALSIDERLAVANMTTEWGALAGVFPIDATLVAWYEKLVKGRELTGFLRGSSVPSPTIAHPRLSADRVSTIRDTAALLSPDLAAQYSKTLTLDLSTLVPHVSGPNSVKVSTDLPTLSAQNIAINKAYLVSCTNSRASDLKAAADVVRGRQIAPGVEFYIAAASSLVQADSEAAGDWGALVAAGAKTLPAGCGPCIGLGTGLLEDGEVGISATNRNYKGRMGSPKAQAYLASPAVVAASAISGRICAPEEVLGRPPPQARTPMFAISSSAAAAAEAGATSTTHSAEELLPAFPPLFSGPLLFAPQDNINTDGIYPGKYTYQDDITPQQQADVVMENYDPTFARMVDQLAPASFATAPSPPAQMMAEQLPTPSTSTPRGAEASRTGRGVILASGYNFGTGSSREQAATAIRNAGIPLVICGSFGDIFKRNSINNGLICLEAPEMIADLTKEFASGGKRGAGGRNGELTVATYWDIEVSSADGSIGVVVCGPKGEELERRRYRTQAVGRSVQEIFLAGGLEQWVKSRLTM